MKVLEKICEILDAIASFISSCFAIAIIVMIFANIFMRFVCNSPLTWQYEATLVCTAWMVFIGMSMTTAHSEHMRLVFVLSKLPARVGIVWENVIDGLLIFFMAVGCIKAYEIALSNMNQYYQTLPMVSKGMFYIPFCIGAVFSVIHLVYHILRRSLSMKQYEGKEA